jgi:hypothetical protein
MSRPRRWFGLFLTLALSLALRHAAAQEFRVFTVVYDVAAAEADQRPPAVARAATLFHAGKVYDYVDAADEVTVFEPTERRFRVLSPSRGLVATVEFDEITHHLKIARDETQKHLTTLSPQSPGAVETAEFLRFQLAPRFAESFDSESGSLTLEGGPLRYEARTAAPQQPRIAAAYLDYADWACRLNYLLHPGALLPEPRIALNESLRSKGRLPAAVILQTRGTPLIHLRAEHTIALELNSQDRGLIHQWESQLRATATRHVTLRDYQRAVLTAQAR